MRKVGQVSLMRRVKIVPPVLEDKEVTGVEGREGVFWEQSALTPPKPRKRCRTSPVKEAGAGRVSQGLIQEVVGLARCPAHGEHHGHGSRCRRSACASAGRARQSGPHPAGVVRGGSEGGTQEGAAPGQGHHLKGRQMKRASAAGRPPVCAGIHLHVGPGSGPLGPLELQEAL